ncbi:arylamine N-acetyltransferase family protein [Streptomyces sp. Wh19]|uniref:arylamine N-acetyltransferase family protein n=1 Tax=Streptomyces sp. Wh19 TaxID=3076629 RepID=UPI00295869A9|nr:arylamine N-acetyltransferase [Streptomyces sp. Wh19]MDV9194743.1 arylamine N-acetyltransferase [Streptomyces sp. Wh19]
MADIDLNAYLARIGYDGPLTPTSETLRSLCWAHVRSVPFELLDGPDGITPAIDPEGVFEKVVRRHQGGACMEVNNLFATLLSRLGYDVTPLAARPWLPQERAYTESADHMVLLVRLDDADWLVDVAYSQLTAVEPIRIDGTVSHERGWDFQVLWEGAEFVASRRGASGRWTPIHRFTLEPRGEQHFDTIVDLYLNPARDSPIPRTLMCSRVTAEGKVLLVNDLFIEAVNGVEHSSRIETPEACRRAVDRVLVGHPQLAERAVRIWQRLIGDRLLTATPGAGTTAHNREEIRQ